MTNEASTTNPIEIEVENTSYADLLTLISSSMTQPNPKLPHYKSGYFRLCGQELTISCSKRDGEGQFWYAEYGKKATPEEIDMNSLYGGCLPIRFYKNAKSFRGIYNFIKECHRSEQERERLKTV